MEVEQHLPGMFSWADMSSPDRSGSVRFYGELLRLDSEDGPMGDMGVYTTLRKAGRKSCAIYDMPPMMKPVTGGFAVWQTYFAVESADAAATRVQELGGTVIMGPADASTSGRMVFAQDPTGAHFFLWQAGEHTGAEVFAEPGALSWSELFTRDTEAAADFYGGLFGWSTNPHPTPDGGEYFEYQLDGSSAAGMLAIKDEWGEMEARWSIYFAVADLEQSREKARSLGAKEIAGPIDVEGVGRFVTLQDPQGGYASIIQLARAA